jgi:hypothetical protein
MSKSAFRSISQSRAAKEDILRDLASWPLVLEDVAHAQSRLHRGNGKHPEED